MCKLKPLDSLVEQVTDKVATRKDPSLPYIGLEHITQGGFQLLGTLRSEDSVSVNSTFQRGDILFGKLRPNLKKSVCVAFEGYCSTDILVLRPRQGVCSAFAAKVFQSDLVFNAAVASSEGTKMPRTSWSSLRRFLVLAPSFKEQQQIAEILDTLDEAIHATRRLISKLENARNGLLHDLLTKGLDENGNLRDPERQPEVFKDTEIGRVPNNWDVLPLSAYTLSSAFGPRFPSDAYAANGNVATLRTTDLDDQGNVNAATMPRAELNLALYREHLLEHDDFLVTRSGTCGIAAVFGGHELPVLPGAFLIRFRLSGDLLPAYLRQYCNWEVGRARLLREAEGGVQKNLRGSTLLAMTFPVPQVPEQKRIIKVLSQASARTSGETKYLRKLEALKKGLMDDLLTGRVQIREAAGHLEKVL